MKSNELKTQVLKILFHVGLSIVVQLLHAIRAVAKSTNKIDLDPLMLAD